MQKNKLYFVAILILSLFCAVGVQGFCFTQENNKVYAEESYWNGSVATSFAGGDGTVEAPYQISNAEELALLRNILSVEDGNPYLDSLFNVAVVRQSHFVLTNDIYLNDEKFEYDADSGLIKILYGENHENVIYRGTNAKGASTGLSTCFDATASIIDQYYVSRTESTTASYYGTIYAWNPIGFNMNTGAFKGVLDGKNHTIFGMYLNNLTGEYGGLFSGLYSETYSTAVKNLSLADGVVLQNGYVGGIAGYASQATIENCNNANDIIVRDSGCAGIIGVSLNSTIKNCGNSGNIYGVDCDGYDNQYVGGVVGVLWLQSILNSCYNSGNVSGKTEVGGICGVAMIVAELSNCGNTGTITGTENVGGISGGLAMVAKTENCFNAGNVNGSISVGGICGNLSGQIREGEDSEVPSEVLNCYSTGTITGDTKVGAITGGRLGNERIDNCFYLAGSATDGDGYAQNGVGSPVLSNDTTDSLAETAPFSDTNTPIDDDGDPSTEAVLLIDALNDYVAASPNELETWKSVTIEAPILRLETRWREIDFDQDYSEGADVHAYVKNGESGFYTTLSCDIVYDFEAPTREGYSFQGYYTKRGNGTQIIKANGELCPSVENVTNEDGQWDLLSDRTMYAHWGVGTYSITYQNMDGATLNSAPTTHIYDVTTTLVSPTKAGYVFAGWFASDSFLGEPLETLNANAYTSDITLYAKWTNTVVFQNWDGTLLYTATVTTGSDAVYVGANPTKPQTLQKVFTFAGWGEAADADVSNVLENITANKIVYAIYTQNARPYNILVNKNDGTSTTANLVVHYGEQQTDFSTLDDLAFNPGRVGYSLLGLYTLAEDGVCVIENADGVLSVKASVSGFSSEYGQWIIEDDQQLFAHWTPKVLSITYKDEDNEAFSGNNLFELTSTHSYTATTTLVAAQKQNYDFLGWYNSAECFGDAISEVGEDYNPSDDFTLYAKWALKSFSVVYKNYNGDNLASLSIPYGSSAIYPNPNPIRSQTTYERYVFSGWVTSAGGNVFADLTSVVEDVTVFAHYDILPAVYNVVLNKNDGTTDSSTINVEYNKSQTTIVPPSRTGYDFEGYYSADSGGVKVVDSDGELMADVESYVSSDKKWVITQNTNLYAQYSAKLFAISYKDVQNKAFSGGNLSSLPAIHVYNAETSLVPATSTHYNFAGWFANADGLGDSLVSLSAESLTAPITLYAKWTPKEYEITFKNDDGSIIKTQNVDYGSMPVFTGDLPTKATSSQYQYAFLSWQPTLSIVTGQAEYAATYTSTARSYEVAFYNEDGTTLLETATVVYGQAAVYLGDAPTKTAEGKTYSFVGWTTTSGGTTLDDLTNVVANRSVYANFEEAAPRYRVDFFNYDGSLLLYSVSVVHGLTAAYGGQTPTKPDSTTSTYSFSGWCSTIGGSTSATLSNITASAVVYAMFATTPKMITVKFYNETTNTFDETSVPYGETAEYPSGTPTKSSTSRYDYAFAGWVTAPNGEVSATLSNTTENISVYPKFNKVEKTFTVKFYNESGTQVLATKSVNYGGSVEFFDEPPTKTIDGKNFQFDGWKISTTSDTDAVLSVITKDTSVFASFVEPPSRLATIWYILMIAAAVLILTIFFAIKIMTKKSLILFINDQKVATFKYKHGEKIVLPTHFLRNDWYINKLCTKDFETKYMGYNTLKIYAKDERALKERPKAPPKTPSKRPHMPPPQKH